MAFTNGRSRKDVRRPARQLFKAIMRSYKFKLPRYDFPLRLRPWFVLFTALVMLLLAFLGFTNFKQSLPLNDKILRLICFCLSTTVFYFIFDADEDARRIWIWRHAPLILTATVCFFFGGIISEIVQSLLPFKQFEIGDIAANLAGSAIGLWTAYHLEKYYRNRKEISRLYRPVALDADEQVSSDDDEYGTMLLPTHHSRTGLAVASTSELGKGGRARLNDVWDEREELFGIGESDSDEESGNRVELAHSTRGTSAITQAQQSTGPKIVVTSSS